MIDDLFRDLVRQAVREEMRAVLREEMPRLLPQEQTIPAGEYLTAEAAARIAGVSPATIRQWASGGTLPCCHAGRLLRIKRGDLESYLRGKGQAAAEPSNDEIERNVVEFLNMRGG